MRTSWRRLPFKGNNLTSWTEAYQFRHNENVFTAHCLYEDVGSGTGDTLEEAKADFLENIRLRIAELSEMLEFCAVNQPKQAK